MIRREGRASSSALRERAIADDETNGAVGARTDGGPPLVLLRGRFLVAHGLVATAVTLPSTHADAGA